MEDYKKLDIQKRRNDIKESVENFKGSIEMIRKATIQTVGLRNDLVLKKDNIDLTRVEYVTGLFKLSEYELNQNFKTAITLVEDTIDTVDNAIDNAKKAKSTNGMTLKEFCELRDIRRYALEKGEYLAGERHRVRILETDSESMIERYDDLVDQYLARQGVNDTPTK